jgi:predicted nucleotidyltransferase component of viral defense system
VKDFFEKLNALGKPRRSDIIEKDYHLHRTLTVITQDDYLSENLAFKGGTCLVKAYTGYFRFSEDIDFTWTDKSLWENGSRSAVKRRCSSEITKLVLKFYQISKELELEFTDDKTDTNHVHISSGGRMVLFFIDYFSYIQNLPARIKIEINFVDETYFPFKKKSLKSFVDKIDSEELRFLYTKMYNSYCKPISINCYDPREIFIEKCRASLTRKVYKLRDILDIYHLEKKFGYSITKYQPTILKKIRFMLDLYERYNENIELLNLPEVDLTKADEMKLMIVPPPKDLGKNVKRIHKELEAVQNKL